MSACGIRAEFLGIDLDPCEDEGTVVTVGRCEMGHERTRIVCETHAESFRRFPDRVDCAACHEAGIASHSTVTVSGESA